MPDVLPEGDGPRGVRPRGLNHGAVLAAMSLLIGGFGLGWGLREHLAQSRLAQVGTVKPAKGGKAAALSNAILTSMFVEPESPPLTVGLLERCPAGDDLGREIAGLGYHRSDPLPAGKSWTLTPGTGVGKARLVNATQVDFGFSTGGVPWNPVECFGLYAPNGRLTYWGLLNGGPITVWPRSKVSMGPGALAVSEE